MKKVVVFIILLIFMVAGMYGYYEYTRRNIDLKDIQPEYSIDAISLINDFKKDTTIANKKYAGKIIEVSGRIKNLDKEGVPIVIALGMVDDISTVQCSMDSSVINECNELRSDDLIFIKGLCAGGKTENLLGTDVILNRCIFQKK